MRSPTIADAVEHAVVRLRGTDVEARLLYVKPSRGTAKVRMFGRHGWLPVDALEVVEA